MNIVFYNVENLFDTLDNPFFEDGAFLPDSGLKWNEKRYILKLQRIAKVLQAVEGPSPMAIGFAEVENRKVLQDLVAAMGLTEQEIGIIHEESPDERGIDVGFIYRRDLIKETQHFTYPVVFKNNPNDKTRDILHVKAILNKGEALHFFIVHWPSRREGTKNSLPRRIEAAKVLRQHIQLVLDGQADAKILLMGDFNTDPDSPPLKNVLDKDKSQSGLLHNLSREAHLNNQGSINYKGKWLLFDQMLASKSLIDNQNGIRIKNNSFSIFKKEWMLFYNQKYKDLRPHKTYGGRKYHGGFSDHLPVCISLEIGKK